MTILRNIPDELASGVVHLPAAAHASRVGVGNRRDPVLIVGRSETSSSEAAADTLLAADILTSITGTDVRSLLPGVEQLTDLMETRALAPDLDWPRETPLRILFVDLEDTNVVLCLVVGAVLSIEPYLISTMVDCARDMVPTLVNGYASATARHHQMREHYEGAYTILRRDDDMDDAVAGPMLLSF